MRTSGSPSLLIVTNPRPAQPILTRYGRASPRIPDQSQPVSILRLTKPPDREETVPRVLRTISLQRVRPLVGDKFLKRSADQFLMRTAGSATVCIVGRDAAVRGIATALSQDEANIVRVVQRIAEHPLERRRIELTILHSFGP